jgi:hypothetical protein
VASPVPRRSVSISGSLPCFVLASDAGHFGHWPEGAGLYWLWSLALAGHLLEQPGMMQHPMMMDVEMEPFPGWQI